MAAGDGWLYSAQVLLISIEPSFGLLFGDLLKKLNVATTGAAVIMSTLDAMVNFSGLFVGPLIKKWSFRKVGLAGGLLSAAALMSTSAANSMLYIITTYGVIGGIGFGLATASTFVALNSYFVERRGQAVGLAMAGTALGFMAMPQVVSFLLMYYDFRSAVLILGAISLNSLIGASLLQPVQRHLKPVPVEPEEAPPQEDPSQKQNRLAAARKASRAQKPPRLEIEEEPEEEDEESEERQEQKETLLILGTQDVAMRNQTVSECSEREPNTPNEAETDKLLNAANILHTTGSLKTGRKKSYSVSIMMTSGAELGPNRTEGSKRLMPRNSSAASMSRNRKTSVISNVSLLDFMGSTMHFDVDSDSDEEDDKGIRIDFKAGQDEKKEPPEECKKPLGRGKSYWTRFARLMDLDLLKDTVYLNILFGLSITYVAELNFKMVVPFFMADLGYTKRQTAMALSMMAVADIAARVIVPPVLDRLSYSRRSTLMFGCACVALFRSLLAEQTGWIPLLACLLFHGFFRGMTLINFPLVISEYATPEKYPAALGLSMVSKGCFIVLFGPLVGYIRDVTDSYPICIHTQSLMILTCVLAWGLEYIIDHRKNQKLENLEN